MKAILLMAGPGKRVLPLTKTRHKGLFPVVNRPIVEIIIDYLRTAGVDKIGINLHHLSNQVYDFFKNKNFKGVEFEFLWEEELLDTGGGLANFRDFIGNDDFFIYHTCDVLCNYDMKKAVKYHNKTGAVVTVTVVDLPGRNAVLIDQNDNIIDIRGELGVARKESHKFLYGSGVNIYSREIFDWLPPPGRPYPVNPTFKRLMTERPGAMKAYTPEEKFYWKDIGSPEDYVEAHRDVLVRKKVSFPGVEQPEDGKWIHPAAVISENAELNGFVSISKDAVIGEGAKIKDCIIWEGVKIPTGANFKNSIITKDLKVIVKNPH